MLKNIDRGSVFVVVQAILALSLTGSIIYMYVVGLNVPEALVGLVGLVVGHFFGERASAQQMTGYKAAADALATAMRRAQGGG